MLSRSRPCPRFRIGKPQRMFPVCGCPLFTSLRRRACCFADGLVFGRLRVVFSSSQYPKLDTQYPELLALVTERLVAKGVTAPAVAAIEAVVEPQAIVAVAGSHAQKACLAVNVVVVDARVRERLEADRLAWCGRRLGAVVVGEGRAGWARNGGYAREVRRVGGRQRREECEGRGAPEEALAVAKVLGCWTRIFGEVSTECLVVMWSARMNADEDVVLLGLKWEPGTARFRMIPGVSGKGSVLTPPASSLTTKTKPTLRP